MSGKKRGKRKKRTAAATKSAAPPRAAAPASAPAPRPASSDGRPEAPWGKFPLAELVILAGIVFLVIGIATNGFTTTALGVALAGLGGLEVAIREHLAGYRSHSSLLAGAVAVLVLGLLLFLAKTILLVAVGGAAVAFAIAFFLARRAFQRASGGLSFRVGGMRG